METLEEYTERMSHVEGDEPRVIGRACYGNYRTVFKFENQVALMESRNYRTCVNSRGKPPIAAQIMFMLQAEPKDVWISDYMIYGKNKAEKVAKHYNAKLAEAPYADEEGAWFSLVFEEFEALMKFFYERKNGVYVDKFGNNKQKFVACEGLDQTPQEVL